MHKTIVQIFIFYNRSVLDSETFVLSIFGVKLESRGQYKYRGTGFPQCALNCKYGYKMIVQIFIFDNTSVFVSNKLWLDCIYRSTEFRVGAVLKYWFFSW